MTLLIGMLGLNIANRKAAENDLTLSPAALGYSFLWDIYVPAGLRGIGV